MPSSRGVANSSHREAEKAASIYQLQEWLGHANLNMMQVYVLSAKLASGEGHGADDTVLTP